MCSPSAIEFGQSQLSHAEVFQKEVLEVGALDVNGSLRGVVGRLQPLSYRGVDIVRGPGVDEICDVGDLIRRYGRESFDVVICTEVVEHVRDWRGALSNLKGILKPNGVLLLTTRSLGFPYHAFPFDFWRYEGEDMNAIFRDLLIQANEQDPIQPGVFVKAVKPESFREEHVEAYELYSMVKGRRCRDVTRWDILFFILAHPRCVARQFISYILPRRWKAALTRLLLEPKRA